MAKHTAKHSAAQTTYNLITKETTVHRIGKDWVHTNKPTGEVTIHPGQINAVLLPETVNTNITVTWLRVQKKDADHSKKIWGNPILDKGPRLWNNTEMGLHLQTTGHCNFRLYERRTPHILIPQPKKTTQLAAPVHRTKSWVHSASTGTPHRRLHSAKSRWIQ